MKCDTNQNNKSFEEIKSDVNQFVTTHPIFTEIIHSSLGDKYETMNHYAEAVILKDGA